MRGNSFIDYQQLGLNYKLLKMDVLYNRILVYCQMKMFDEAGIDMYDSILCTSPDYKTLSEVIQRREPPAASIKYIDNTLYIPPKHQPRSKSAPPRTQGRKTEEPNEIDEPSWSFTNTKHLTKSSSNKVI